MAKQDAQGAVSFRSEAEDVEFAPDRGGGIGERIGEAAQNVNWNKVGIGVGAAAAVAGAAYAATKFIGRGEAEGGQSSSSGGKQRKS